MKIKLNRYIDHTLLKPAATKEDIKKLCMQAKKHHFYSVCVNPYYVHYASTLLEGTDTIVASVIGFPLGANLTVVKELETTLAVSDGAGEIDMVMNIGAFKNGAYDEVLNDINAVCRVAHRPVKVIIETSQLNEEEIVKACEIVNNSNALFIKTSTGFVGEGAKLEHIELMAKHMNPGKLIKASGGIRDKETALAMIKAGASRLGTSSGVKIMDEVKAEETAKPKKTTKKKAKVEESY